MSSKLAQRVALLHLAEDEGEELTYQDWLKRQPPSGVVNPISAPVLLRIKTILGPNAMYFFELYGMTRAIMDGAPPPPEGLVGAWKTATRTLARVLAQKLGDRKGPEVINSLYDRMNTIKPLFRKMEGGGYWTQPFRAAGEQLAAILVDVCRAIEIPITTRPGPDAAKWPLVRKSSEKEEQLDTLRIENPALYAKITEAREAIKRRESDLLQSVNRAGMLPVRGKIQGQIVQIGVDPVTNERMVFTNDGRVVGVDQFKKEAIRKDKKDAKSLRVFPNGLPKAGRELSLEGIRTLSDEELKDPEVIPPSQSLGYSALTDDLTPEEGMRIYPTMLDSKGQAVCVAGRFRGVYMDDLVNRAGRLIEGAAYDFDANGKIHRFETKRARGLPIITVRKEPYMTVLPDGRFMIKLPTSPKLGDRDPYKVPRNELDKIAQPTVIPTIEKVEKTMGTTFTFHAKDFVAVRRIVGGMVMSKGASETLAKHFDQLSRQERALAEEATKNFSLAQIGGFKIKSKIDPDTGFPFDPPVFTPDLFTKQKQALSWAESRGYSGLLALDTGIGKTLSAIALMKKMERDGFASEEARFLYVCPVKLRGNFSKQARSFLQDAKAFLDRVDVVSYPLFVKNIEANPNYGSVAGDVKAGIPPYAIVVFDEAQVLVKSETSRVSRAAQMLKHPRKVLLTASPMEESPDELYVGVAITNNINLNARSAPGTVSPAMRDMARFRERFCQKVGGRVLGLKPSDDKDRTKTADFQTWAKSNFFAANKRDVIENPLPELRQEVKVLQMDPAVEAIYRVEAQKIAKTLNAAFAVYRDKGKAKGGDVKDLFSVKLRKSLNIINKLGNMPSMLVPGSKSPKVDTSVEIVRDRISKGVRTLLFTDSPDFAKHMCLELSTQVPTLLHAVALAGEISVFQNGKKVSKYTERQYLNRDGEPIAKTEWASHVLQEVLGGDPQVASLVLTSTYTLGQNLQMFSTVVQLDRDTFSSEMMKQRTARSWRTGQNTAVDEITLDIVYGDTTSTSDSTLDELRKAIQNVQESLFNEVVGQSQGAAIGKEWSEMGLVDASLVAVSRKLLERALTPLPAFMGEQDSQ